MMLLSITREVAGLYLAITLATTGLAKLRSWRATSTGLIVEKVVPRSIVAPTVIAVSVIELSLAAFFAIGWYRVAVGCVTAFTFLCFGAYKVAVSIRMGIVPCSCYGASKTYRATRPGVLAALTASLIQAALACTWAFTPGDRKAVFALLVVGAFTVPVAVFLIRLDWSSALASPASRR
jgi:hypothetical protein